MQIMHTVSIAHAHFHHRLSVHIIHDHTCQCLQFFIFFHVSGIFDQDNALLVHFCHIVSGLGHEQILDCLHRGCIFLAVNLNHENNTFCLFNMQLLGLIVHVHHEHISKQDILHKIITVKLLHISGCKIPYLANCQPSYHISIFCG